MPSTGSARRLPRFGKLDIMVGNAGLLGEMSPMHHIDTDVWTEVVDVNRTRTASVGPQIPCCASQTPGVLCSLRRGSTRETSLLGCLCRNQSRAGDDGLLLGCGNGGNGNADQPAGPGRNPHEDAGRRLPRRRPLHGKTSRGYFRCVYPALFAGLRATWRHYPGISMKRLNLKPIEP